MRKIARLWLFLILFIPIVYSFPYLCCRDRNTLVEKCYATGQCCNGKWYERCVDFEVWVDGKKLTIGEPSTLNVYVRNIGAFQDSYSLSYQVLSGNVIVSWNNKKQTAGPNDVAIFQPIIILLDPSPTRINFRIRSDSNLEKDVTVTLTGESMYSMSEPGLLFIFILLVPPLYLILRQKVYEKV
ncbi:MAG: hypothetical protein QXM38_03020 [Candidatus Aenigmatarchaeota archaeon]